MVRHDLQCLYAAMVKCLCTPFSSVQTFLSMNKLCHFCSQSFLSTPLFGLFDMQLHNVINLRKGEKSEELQVPFYRIILLSDKKLIKFKR